MTTKKSLRNLLNNYELVNKLERIGITTAKDLLESNKYYLMNQLSLSLKDIDIIIYEASGNLFDQNKITCLEIFNEITTSKRFMSTSVITIDNALRGGLPIGSITEIVGSPGTGKTQFCLGVCIQSLVDHWKNNSYNDGGVLYYDTENKFDATRFKKIAISKFPELFDPLISTDASHRLDKLCSKVEIRKVNSTNELNEDISSKETKDLIVERGISLIIIDSIACLFKNEYGGDDRDKEKFLMAPAAMLKTIADKAGVTVLVTNQISQVDSSFDDTNIFGDTYIQNSSEIKPFLGPTWHHCITSRLVMQSSLINFIQSDERFIHLTKSPIAPYSKIMYTITDAGITCLSNDSNII